MLLSYIGWRTLMANPPPSLFTTRVCRENDCASQVLPTEKRAGAKGHTNWW
jgi:hypothetical protein